MTSTDRAAAIECTASKNETGSEAMEIDFDYETFQEFNCNSSVDTLLKETVLFNAFSLYLMSLVYRPPLHIGSQLFTITYSVPD